MTIEVIVKIRVKTTETNFTHQVEREINEAISIAFRPAYEKKSFVDRFNTQNGARFIDHYEISSKTA